MRKFNPLAEDHPLVGDECPACHKKFVAGDVTTLVELGPGDDKEGRERARDGKPYKAVAMPVHWACATGEE
jgi:hypothetical protein